MIERHENGFKLAYEVIIKNKDVTDYPKEKKRNKNLEDKETYIACLCNQDGNTYAINISERKLALELKINQQAEEVKELSCEKFSSNEKELISKYLDVFFKPIGIIEEETEEEEE